MVSTVTMRSKWDTTAAVSRMAALSTARDKARPLPGCECDARRPMLERVAGDMPQVIEFRQCRGLRGESGIQHRDARSRHPVPSAAAARPTAASRSRMNGAARSLTRATMAGAARSGVPASKGGCGSYSTMS